MEKYITTIEISDTQVRLAVGYVDGGKVNLIHIAERPVTGLVSRGEILDFQTLSSIISSMKEFKDDTTKEKITISEATVILPSFGLNVFQSTKTSGVVSPYSLIATLDIENVVSLVQKEPIPAGNEIVDIIPDSFILEMGRSFVNPPINEKSNNITIKAKIQTLPARVVTDYKRIFDSAHIKVRKYCVSTYALSELGKSDTDIPTSYVLADIGSGTTNISLIGNASPFETVSFQLGSHDLINKIEERMNINKDEARDLLKKYGLDLRALTFKPEISRSTVNGIETKHDPESLNLIINEFFKGEFFDKFDTAYATLMKGYPENVRNLPIVFTGGITKMLGFDALAKEKFVSNASIHYLEPKCLGARHPRYSALIGAIYASDKYKGALSDTRTKTSELQRVREKSE